ncbi:tail fiber protein [Microbulbifer halophilus]|uniref:Tail fiber protein n=1 Tax=Microbulbifer halophilus TaxID=453963 RepID=A0ABW5EEC4_9GAMM|nr:phage tail protein [Microbulbifer halophilus]MCW8127572.1 phage tail protein [Microbulbifer halophilus]
MFVTTPIGSICPFAGQVNPVSGAQNDLWSNSDCTGFTPGSASVSDKSPLIYPENQGWMLCDGRWLPVEGYPELYAVIGTLYGEKTESQVAMFRIPDYRGLFLRGYDAGAGLDPDAKNRNAPDGFGTVANVVGSLQCDTLQDHTHSYDITQPSGVSAQGQAAGTNITSKETASPTKPARSSSETRPKNIAVNFIIKYR